MTEKDTEPMARLISTERLVAFARISGTERGALVLHDQTIRIASALMPVLCLFEIGLRNAICESLISSFSEPNWLIRPSSPFSWRASESKKLADAVRQARLASYAKLSHSEKVQLDAKRLSHGLPQKRQHHQARQHAIDVTHGQLVSQLTLFFWKRLFSADYEDSLWKRSLRGLFPEKTIRRSAVARRLELIYKARNRIAHHEPVYGVRLDELIAAIDFLVVRLDNRDVNRTSPLAELTFVHRENLKSVASEASASFLRARLRN